MKTITRGRVQNHSKKRRVENLEGRKRKILIRREMPKTNSKRITRIRRCLGREETIRLRAETFK